MANHSDRLYDDFEGATNVMESGLLRVLTKKSTSGTGEVSALPDEVEIEVIVEPPGAPDAPHEVENLSPLVSESLPPLPGEKLAPPAIEPPPPPAIATLPPPITESVSPPVIEPSPPPAIETLPPPVIEPPPSPAIHRLPPPVRMAVRDDPETTMAIAVPRRQSRLLAGALVIGAVALGAGGAMFELQRRHQAPPPPAELPRFVVLPPAPTPPPQALPTQAPPAAEPAADAPQAAATAAATTTSRPAKPHRHHHRRPHSAR